MFLMFLAASCLALVGFIFVFHSIMNELVALVIMALYLIAALLLLLPVILQGGM
jgi:hypothetical protein